MKISTTREIELTKKFFSKERSLAEIIQFGEKILQIQQKRFEIIVKENAQRSL